MRGRIAAFVLACALSMPAAAQEASRARLVTVPDADALSVNFPVVALARGVSGRVVLACDVAADGSSACRAAEEAPAGLGFAAAAETVAADWRFEPRTEGGAAVASTVRIPIVFTNPAGEAAVIETQLMVDGLPGERRQVREHDVRMSRELNEISACQWAAREACVVFRSNEDVRYNADYYPEAARAAGTDARVLVACAIRQDRRADCAVDREAPEGAEFGAAALRLVSDVIARNAAQFTPGMVLRVPVDFMVRERDERRPLIWAVVPSANDFMRFYPARAMERNVQGRVVLACGLRADRRLDCAVFEERPPGWEFGPAALQIAQRFQLSEGATGTPGREIGDRFKVPITFLIG
jgi:TonB family protein